MKKFEIICKFTGNYLKIYIDGLLHLSIDIYKIRGIKSEVQSPYWFTISYYIEDTEVICQYGNRQIWESILKLLDEHIK